MPSVDQYFGVLEQLDQHIEVLEDEVLENPSPESLQKLNRIKRDTINIRSSVWPFREVIHHLQHSESSLVTKATSVLLSGCVRSYSGSYRDH